MNAMMEERRVIRTIKKVMPAVVSITVSKHLKDIERDIPKELYAELPKAADGKTVKLPDELIDEHGMVQVGGGSGFIVESDGIIVTNKHVISDSNAEYAVITDDGRTFTGTVLTRDPISDVAIVKIDAKHLPSIPLGDSTRLELGQRVVAIGNALGIFKNTVSLGIVSGLSRSIQAQADPEAPPQEMRGLIQTDAAINPGNSGGPLVNLKGYAVGINAAIVSGAQSIGFAIPVNTIKRDLGDLKKYGRIRKPLLGVRYIVIDEKLKEKMNLPVAYGAYIIKEGPREHGVIPGSAAEKSGLKEKDIILQCNGKQVTREHPIQDYLEDLEVGDVVNLLVLRGKEEFKAKVPLTERK